MTTPVKSRAVLGKSGLRQGEDNNKGLENIFFTQAKQRKFLDLLATQRTKPVAGQFHYIDLSHADLTHVDLSGLDLTGVNLTNANLTGANLTSTNLAKAKLVRTILCNALLADVDLTDATIDRTTQLSLQQAKNQQWVQAAQKSIKNFNQQWEKIKGMDGFNAFETVLKHLLRNDVTTAEIVEVIAAIVQSADIRDLVFLAAHGVDVHCYAHLLAVFNTIQCLARFGKLLDENACQLKILDLATRMATQNLLDEATLPIMRHQWSEGRRACNGEGTGPNFNEAHNVQLALRHQLAAQLELPFPVKNPKNAVHIAELNQSDKEFAIDFVNKHLCDQSALIDALTTLPAWQLYLKRIFRKKMMWAELDEELNEAQKIALETRLSKQTEKVVFACKVADIRKHLRCFDAVKQDTAYFLSA